MIKRLLTGCKFSFLTIIFLLAGIQGYGANRYSVATGNWNATSTWSATSGGTAGATAPVAADNAYVEGGWTVTVNANAACTNVSIASGSTLSVGGFNFAVSGLTTVNGAITFTNTAGTKTMGTVTIAGGTWTSNVGETYGITALTLSGSTINGSATGILNVGSNLSVTSGTTNTLNATTITVTGTSTIDGNLTFASTSGTKIFTGLTIVTANGTWNNTINEAITFRGGLTNNGVFTAGTSTYTFDTNNQPITGTLSIPSITITGVTLTNNGSLTIGTALAGNGGLTQGLATSVLNIGGTSGIPTLTATVSGNLVNFLGATQTVNPTTYSNLTLSGSGTKTTTGVTVNGLLSIEGTATLSLAPTYGTAATLQYNTTTSRTAGVEWISPFAPTGGIIVAGTGSITMNSAEILSASVPLTINNGATLATANFQLTLGGNFNNSGTFTAGSSNIVITGSAATQSIGGFTTTGTVSVTKTSGTATFTGTVNGGALAVGAGATPLNLGTGLTHTFGTLSLGGNGQPSGSWGGTGSTATFINPTYFAASSGIANISTSSCTAGYWIGATNTDWNTPSNWCSGIVPTASTNVVIPAGGNQPVIGAAALCNSLTINSGATLVITGSNTLTVSGNWANNGTFTANTGTVIFNGAAQTVGTGPYNNLTLSGSGVKTITGVTVNGILSMEGTASTSAAPTYGSNATLQYNKAGAFTAGPEWIANFSATGGILITNTGTITLNSAEVLNAPMTINSGASFSMSTFLLTLNSNLINNGGTVSGTGTTGGVTIAGTATQSIGSFTTTGTVSMTKTAGTATLTGNINGGSLTINGSGGTLTLDNGTALTHTFTGAWTQTAGTLNCNLSTLTVSTITNTGGTFNSNTGTVVFTGTATIPNLNYYNLSFTGTTTKIFGTGVTISVANNWNVSSPATMTTTAGATVTGSISGTGAISMGSGTITLGGDFTNTGTFTCGTGTVNYNGVTQQVMGNTYYNLTLSNSGVKTTASATVTVNNNLTIAGSATFNLTYGVFGNATGIFSMAAGTNLIIGTAGSGNMLFPTNFTSANISLNSSSTVTYNSDTNVQTVSNTPAYGNLVISNLNSKSILLTATPAVINGTLQVNAGNTFGLGAGTSGYALNIIGNAIINGTLDFGGGGISKILNLTGNLSGSGSITQTTNIGHTLNLGGANNSIGSFVTFIGSGSTVNYNGAGSQQIFASPNYINLTISGGGAKTLQGVTSVGNILTLTSGILTTTSTNLLSVTNTATTAIAGGSATSFINGPVNWTLPASLVSGSTYTFPVGIGSTYLPFALFNPTTSGTATAQVSAFTANPGGTFDATLVSISNTEYWALTTSGSFTNSSVSLTQPTAIAPLDAIGGSLSLTGPYTSLAGTAGTNGVSASNVIGTNRFFVLAGRNQTVTTGTISGSPFCAGAIVSVPYSITGTYTSGNIFTAQLSNASGSFTSPVAIGTLAQTTAGTISGTIPAGTASGTAYRIRVVSTTPVVTGTDNGTNLTVSPGTTISSQSTSAQTQCINGSFTAISVTATGTGTLTYQWYSNTTASTTGGTSLGSANGAQTSSYTPQATSAGTLYYYCVVTGTCGTVTSTVSGAFLVTSSVGGTISGAVTEICQGGSTGTMTLSGYSGTILEWDRQLNSGGWSNAGNYAVATYSEVPYSGGTWQYRAVVQNGSCPLTYSSVVTVLIDPTTTVGYLGGGPTPICQGAMTGVMTLASNTGAIIRWEKRVNSGSWTNISNTSNTYSEIPSSAGTWDYQVLVQSGICSSLYSNINTIVVTPTLSITLGPNPTICKNTTVAQLSYTATTGSPTNFTINFDAAALSAGMANQTGWQLNANSITINVPYSIATGVYNGILSVITNNPICSSVGYPITVTVQDNTQTVAITGSTAPCQGTSQTYSATNISGATYTWIFPSGWVQTGGGTSGIVTVTVGSGSGNIQVTPSFTCGNGTTQTLAVAPVVLPTATISYAGTPFCKSVSTAQNVTLTGTSGGTYTASPTGLTINPSSGAITPSSSTAGTYTVTYSITSSGGCGAVTATTSVTITNTPVATFSYAGSPYCSNATNPSPTFSGGAVAGTFSSAPGLVFVSTSTGQVNLASSTPATYTVTNTIAAAGGCSAITATSSITVNPNLPASVSIAAAANPVCSGTSVTFTATPTNGGTTPSYQWKVNGINAGTNSSTYSYTPINNDAITCVLTSNATCATGSPATSNTVTMTVNPNLPVSVSITASANPVCPSTSVTFTATPTNGGTSPTYQWKVNGTIVGANSATYSYTPANSDAVTCVLTSNATCATGSPATSNTVTMTVNPNLPVSISIAASANPVCPSTLVTFTATPTNGGSSPTYQWKVNGTNAGTNSATYTYTPANNNTITCVLTSNATCATGSPATSNTVTMTVNPNLPVSILIAASANPVCSGTSLTFSATPTNGGTTPSYQWKVNGNNVGINIGTYSYVPVNSDAVTCVLTSSATCATGNPATSNAVTMTVNPNPTVNAGSAMAAICQGGTSAALGGSFGGGATAAFWSASSGTFSNNAGSTPGTSAFTAAANSVSPITLTLTTSGGYCGTVVATKQIVVNSNPTVSVGGVLTAICQGETTTALGGSFGGGATAAIWSDNGAGGTFTNNSGSTPSTTTYSATSSSLTPVTLTLTTSGGSCGITSASKQLTVNPNPTVNVGGVITAICQGGTTTPLGGLFGGGATAAVWSDGGAGGTFTNNSGSTPSTTTYTATSSSLTPVTLTLTTSGGSCGITSASKQLTVNPNPTVNVGGALTAICQGGTTTALGGSFGGGATAAVWSDGAAGGTFTNNSGSTPSTTTYTASLSSSTPVTLTLTTSGGSCGTAFASKQLTVNPNPTMNVGGALTAICQGGTTTALGGSFGGGATAAVWSDGAAGGTFTNNSGSTPSTTTYTATSSSLTPVTLTLTTSGGSCSTAFASKQLTVNPNPTVNVGGAKAAICQGGTTTALGGSFGGGATAAVWSDGGAGGTFTNNSGSTPSTTTYTASSSSSTPVTLTLTTSGGSCSTAFASTLLTVNPNPTVNVGPVNAPVCQGGTTVGLGGTFGGGATAAVWSDGGAGGTFTKNSGSTPSTTTYTASSSSSSTVTLTLTTSGGSCGIASASKQLTVNPNPTVNVGPAFASICQGGTTTALGGSFGGGATAAVWSDGGAGGTLANNAGNTPGTTTYTASATFTNPVTLTITTSGGSCGNVSANKQLTVIPTVTINPFSPATSTRCQGAGTVTNTTTAINSTDLSYSLDAVSLSGGNSIVASTGAVTYSAAWSGTTTITASAAGCNGPVTATFVETVTPTVGTPVFAMGATSSRCRSSNSVTYTATATNNTGITYTLDSGSITGGNTIDSGAGTVSYIFEWRGTSIITATATGCNGPFTAIHTVTTIGDLVWTGAISTDWNTIGNWSCPFLPDLTTNVLIPNVTNQPILSSGVNGMANNIVINSGSSLTVTGNTIQIAGAITNNGTFAASSGTIQMAGSAAQTIGTSTFAGNTILNLTISNSAGVTLGGPLNVTGVVKAATGDLSSAGNLVLISTASQTALIDGSGANNVTGNVTMQRYLPSAYGYKYVSSPFQSATVGGFSSYLNLAATFPSFYKYNENNSRDSLGVTAYQSGWVNYTTGTNLLAPLSGYAANFGTSGTPETFSLTGAVNNGPLSVSLMNNNRKYTQGFNLAGNPYPSPINWNASGWTKINIDNAIYFFNAGTTDQYSGVYSSYVNGVATGNGTNLIASMQGFLIHVSDGTYPITGTLKMTNSVRTNDLALTFRDATLDSRTILRFTANLETNNPVEDVALLYFENQAGRSFNKELDALKLYNTDVLVPNLYTLSAELKQLSIYAIPQPTDSITKIPLGIKTLSDGWVDFKARDISLLPASLYIYLADNLQGITQDLKKNPGYRFYLKGGTYNQRFSLIFSRTELNPIAPGTEKLFILKRSASQYTVTLNIPGTSGGSLMVTNMSGQIIMLSEVFDQQTVEINPGSSSGLYIITVISGNRRQSEKILKR